MTIQNLQTAYIEARNGLISLVEHLRADQAKYDVDRHEILELFQSLPLWKQLKTKSGHATFKHEVTGVVIGFQTHGDITMKPKQALALRECVQTHLNILCNDIFKYELNNWKSAPDYDASLLRYKKISK